ncbi:MAG TPA: hypothetical protein VNU97_14260 [Rhizomicrobium sp.]|jgi:hypothetical protein|nr:hypothetical protein [Rhizomicrobium sp.]
MAGKAKKKVFFPKTRLAELAARAGGVTRDDAIDGAMTSLEGMRELADAEIRSSIAAMEGIVFTRNADDTLDDGQMNAILRHADQVVTLAGTFCYGALDTAARSLCDVADGLLRAGMHDRKPVAVHVQTMHLLAPGGMTLSPEHAELMLGELAKVTNHFNFGSLAATLTHDADEIVAAAQ